MPPNRAAVLVLVAVLVGAAGGSAVVGAQEDVVTLTVSVETNAGDDVRGATLTATWNDGSTSGTTAANGKTFLDVPEGADVEIEVTHDDYVRNVPLEVEDASDDEVSMTVYPKSSARVLVQDGDGPVADAEVILRKDGREVVRESTDLDGVVTSGTVESGSYTVTVSTPGYFVARRDLAVDDASEITVGIRRGTVTLEINVTDDHFDAPKPVAGATVDVRGSGSVTTQPGGIGRIGVPVNSWTTLQATKEGYRTTEESVFVGEEDSEAEVSIRRTPAISVDLLSGRVVIGESVSLSVTDEYGDPVPTATVRLDGEAVTETDDRGQAVVRISSAGEHEVAVEKGSLDASAQVLGVSAGDDATDGERTDSTGAGAETEAEQPGFGVLVVLLALALVVAVSLAGRSKRQ